MPWTLPYPLGGLASGQRYRYESWILRVVPPWLRRTNGGAMLRAIGAVADALEDRAVAGVRLRFPYEDEDALAIQGREKPGVGDGRAAVRPAHQQRGSVYALLEQWRAYLADAPRAVDVLYHSGTLYKLYENVGLPIDRAIISWSPEGTQWAQAWCFLVEDADPGVITAAEDAALSAIPRLWNAAHMLPLHVILTWPGAALWEYPVDGLTWTEDAALYTWDDVPHTVI